MAGAKRGRGRPPVDRGGHTVALTVRLAHNHQEELQRLVDGGRAATLAGAVRYLIEGSTNVNRQPWIPHGPGVVPPRGWILAQAPGGQRGWVDPNAMRPPTRKRSSLANEEERRIRTFKKKLGRYETTSIKQTMDNFCYDTNPDREIAIWERIAKVFEEEASLRPESEHKLTYRAALACANTTPSVDSLLAADPGFKSLPNLSRLVDRYVEATASDS